VLFSWLLFRESIGLAQALGILASMLGVAIVIARGHLATLLDLHFASGDLWLLGAVVLWALNSVLLRRRPEGLPPLALISVVIAFALLFLMPFYVLELWSGRRVDLGLESALSLLYVSIFASVFAYILWNRGVREVGPNPAGITLQLMPVFGALLAVVFLGEGMSSTTGSAPC
jgi:drug/metabolite transporter (DMT)-like permease